MKYIIPFFASLMCLIIVSCSSDALSDIEANYNTELKSIGNPVKVSLNLTASDFSLDNASTRAEGDEVPIDYSPDEYDAALMVKEKVINDLWVFEYDKESGSLLVDPIYIGEITDDGEGNIEIEVELDDNAGAAVTLYFIANAAGGASADTWISSISDAGAYSTISSLEALNIPFTNAILLDFDGTNGAYNTPTNFALPMSASLTQTLPTEEEIDETNPIEVNLEFMVSKVMFGASLDEESFEEFYDLSGTTIDDFEELSSELYFVNAPTACYKVGALGDKDTSTKVDYFSLNATWLAGKEEINFLTSTSDVTYQYVLYMPENFQGFNSLNTSTSKADNAPASSYTGSTKPWNTDDVNTSKWDENLSILSYMSSTDALCLQATFSVTNARINSDTGNHLYSSVVFPGGNDVDNFNVRRSCVYHTIFTLKFVMYTGIFTITHISDTTTEYFLNEATF